MRLLMVAVLAAAPAAFAQARGGARPMAAPVRPVAPARPAPARPVPSRPLPARPAPARPIPIGTGVAAAPPVYFLGYYPNPLYYGSGYGDGYAQAAPSASSYSAAPGDNGPAPAYYGADPGGQGYPSVLINPNYVPDTSNPVMRDYSYLQPASGDAAPPPAPSVIFLIAMKDHTIYPAIAYWVDEDTLNYITQQGVRNRVSLGLVDRDFSTQLNKERSIDFALPEVKEN